MSNYVNEIIKDLKDNPTTYRDFGGRGVQKANVKVWDYGNTRVLSIIEVFINGNSIPLSYIDKWRLEVAIKRWYKNVSLKTLSCV